jgi:hypothetical protein
MSPVRPRSPAPKSVLSAVHFSHNSAGQKQVSPAEARYPSGKGEVCKTFMRRFDPDPRLQNFLPFCPIFNRSGLMSSSFSLGLNGPQKAHSVSMVVQMWTGFLRPSIDRLTVFRKCTRPLFNERLLKLEHCLFFVVGDGWTYFWTTRSEPWPRIEARVAISTPARRSGPREPRSRLVARVASLGMPRVSRGRHRSASGSLPCPSRCAEESRRRRAPD